MFGLPRVMALPGVSGIAGGSDRWRCETGGPGERGQAHRQGSGVLHASGLGANALAAACTWPTYRCQVASSKVS
jgi:hypothetical protein